MYSTILLCLFTSKYDVNGSRLNYSTVSSNEYKYIKCKSSARTKQSVISVALKTPLEIKLGISIHKTLLQRPDDHGFTPSCPTHILQQNCAHDLFYVSTELR